jgi:hypothetical protein
MENHTTYTLNGRTIKFTALNSYGKSTNKRVDIEIGQLEQLSDFDLTNEIVKAKMQERYGENIPMDEKVISPAAMFNSDKLITVKSN